MERLAKFDGDELGRRMRAKFEQTMAEVAQAVNEAPEGHLIDGSEERCRDVLGEFRRAAYETAVQMRVEATEASPAFSPGEAGSGAPRAGGAVGADVQRSRGSAPVPLRKDRRRIDRHAGG
jgi:hypothetical protein